jgi:acyl-CoA thioesterase-1
MTAFSVNTILLHSDFNKPVQRVASAAAKAWRLAVMLWLFGLYMLASPALAQAPSAVASLPTPSDPGLTVLVVGDSLSAEYGLQRGSGWVALLQQRLAAEKRAVTVVNASISGDTTSGGRSRLPALLKQHRPGIVVIELGGNDALRGLPLEMTEQNLLSMTQAAQKSGARVLLLGMQVPPNYGSAYSASFAGLFPKVARVSKSPLVPFLLKGVADIDDASPLFQRDRIHPNESAHPIILGNVWPELRKLLK